MPRYTAPGVFVDEVAFRAKAILGVPTAVAGFVGATGFGPVAGVPALLTSLADFERIHGGKAQLVFGEGIGACDSYMWNAARAFFEEGGKRLYVARAFTAADGDGRARADPTVGLPPPFALTARYPGRAGNGTVTFTLQLGPNRLGRGPRGTVALRGAVDRDVVHVGGAGAGFRLLRRDEANKTWWLTSEAGVEEELQAAYGGTTAVAIRTLTVTVTFAAEGSDRPAFISAGLPLDPGHRGAGEADSLFARFALDIPGPDTPPIVLTAPDDATGLTILNALRSLYDAGQGSSDRLTAALLDRQGSAAQRSVTIRLAGGNDGLEPVAAAYAGTTDADGGRSGLAAFEMLEDIAIVAAPGATRRDTPDTRATIAALIDHCERMRTRIALVDSIKGQGIADVRALRARYDSSHAAIHYPWVTIVDPSTGRQNVYPPSGFVAGIYARNDVERAVSRAPANEVVHLAVGFETMLNKAQQDVLNPEGINCFRFFAGRGMRLWGARTMASDPERKYVNVRRTLAYLQASIERGIRWAAFEPNDERLWNTVRTIVGEFLRNEWTNGALSGNKPEQAFIVRCDCTTMAQNDLDNGRLVCLIGVALLRPAEFLMFSVTQTTGDAP